MGSAAEKRGKAELRYHECADAREAGKKIKSNKNCIERALELIRGFKEAQARELWRHSGLPPMQITKAAPGYAENLNFSSEKLFSKLTMKEFPEKV